MSNFPFEFGIEQNFEFRGVELSLEERLERERAQVAELKSKLAGALDQKRILGIQRDTAVKAEAVARLALNTARASWASPPPPSPGMEKTIDELKQQLAELSDENASLKRKQDDDTAEVEKWQSELAESRGTVTKLEAKIKQLEDRTHKAESDLKATHEHHDRKVDGLEQELHEQRKANKALQGEVAKHSNQAAHNASVITRLEHDLDTAREALSAKDDETDALAAQKYNVELSLQELSKQWEEDQVKIEELDTLREEMEALHAQQSSYMADQERLTDMLQGHERTLLIKDERIAHLEAQLQKALARNMQDAQAADDANVAAATSLDDDAPPALNGHGENLAVLLSEFENEEEDDDYPYESEALDQSPITATSTEPKEPSTTFTPLALSDVLETLNFAPTEAPKLTTHIHESFSIVPQTAAAPALTLHISEPVSVLPEDVAAPALTQHIHEVGSVEPVAAAPQKLGLSISEVGSTTPTERTTTVSSASVQTDAHELRIAMLPAGSFDITPIAPIAPATVTTSTSSAQTAAPLLTSGVIDAASIAVSPRAPVSNNALAPVIATHEEAPVAATTTKTSTSSTGVQTIEIPIESADTAAPPVIQVVKPNKISFWQWFLPLILSLLAALVAGAVFWYNSELYAWRTANRSSYGRACSPGGSYGNNAYLFNVVPVPLSGSGWFPQSIITALEGWAGPTPTPHY